MKRQRGFSLIELLMVVSILLLLVVLLFPMLASARRSAKESAAVGALKSIAESEIVYASRNTQKYSGSLAKLSAAGYLDSRFANGVSVNSYTYTEGNTVGAGVPASVPLAAPDGFAYSAAPNSVNDGDYNYAVAADGVVYYGTQAPPGATGKAVGN